mgnify:CR=1 FL=1
MEEKRSKWVEDVLRIITCLKLGVETKALEFQEYSTRYNISQATCMIGASLFKAEARYTAVRWIEDILADSTVPEIKQAGSILEKLRTVRRDIPNTFFLRTSTCAIDNAIVNTQIEARLQMYSYFGGEFSMIECAISDALDAGEIE